MEPSEVITNKDTLDFFANTNAYNIVLFIFFAVFVIILITSNRERKYNAKINKELTYAITELTKTVVAKESAMAQQDKKYMHAFNSLANDIDSLHTSITTQRVELSELKAWCMAKNTMQNGGGGSG